MNLHAKNARLYPVDGLCRLFGVTRQACYRYDGSAALLKVAREEFVIQYIREIREKDPGTGGLKLRHMYSKAFGGNSPAGRDRFEDTVDRYGLKVRAGMRKSGTTDSTHGLPLYPNIIGDFIPGAPNQLRVSDMTYIPVYRNEYAYLFCYLSLIPDACTEEIAGWSVGATLETTCPPEALRKALKRIEGQENISLIHHPDRGCRYASHGYVSLLKRHEIRISMTESGDPKENAQAERINNTMKNELLKGMVFHSMEEVKTAVSVAVAFYNNERPHMSIDMMTPAEAAGCVGEIARRWTSYRLIAIKSQLEGLDIAGNGLPLPECQGSPSGLRSPVNP